MNGFTRVLTPGMSERPRFCSIRCRDITVSGESAGFAVFLVDPATPHQRIPNEGLLHRASIKKRHCTAQAINNIYVRRLKSRVCAAMIQGMLSHPRTPSQKARTLG